MKISVALCLTALLLGPTGISEAQDTKTPAHVPLQKTIGQPASASPIPSLAVINAQSATLEGNVLTLNGVAANSIVFADRPVRSAGHVATAQFLKLWDEGKNSLAKDPPNATISVLGSDGSDVSDAVVTLKSPKLSGDKLTFQVAVLEGTLAGAAGPAALFIDNFGFGGVEDVNGGDPLGNSYYDPRLPGAWYGVGDGNGKQFYLPKCGYYPDPPC